MRRAARFAQDTAVLKLRRAWRVERVEGVYGVQAQEDQRRADRVLPR